MYPPEAVATHGPFLTGMGRRRGQRPARCSTHAARRFAEATRAPPSAQYFPPEPPPACLIGVPSGETTYQTPPMPSPFVSPAAESPENV
jgi:hypothetical protein